VFAGSSAVAAREVENAVLRQQLVVLRRTVKAAVAAAEGSMLLAAVSGLLPRESPGNGAAAAA